MKIISLLTFVILFGFQIYHGMVDKKIEIFAHL